MAVKLKEHSQIDEIHEYFSNYLQPSLIGSDGNVFAAKLRICVLIGLTTVAIFFYAI